jgi:hypothetical protein
MTKNSIKKNVIWQNFMFFCSKLNIEILNNELQWIKSGMSFINGNTDQTHHHNCLSINSTTTSPLYLYNYCIDPPSVFINT